MLRKVPASLFMAVVLGFTSQIVQVVFLRSFLMVFHGNELSIGVILASWMVWMGLGSFLGAFLSARYGRTLVVLFFSALGLLIALPATLLLIGELRNILAIGPANPFSLIDITASTLLLMAPACILMGIHFVYVIQLWQGEEQSTDASAAGKTYVSEALRSAIGGIVFTTLLIHVLNPFQTVTIVALGMLLIIVRAQQRTHRPGAALIYISFIGLIGILVGLLGPLNDWAQERQWHHFLPQHELLEVRPSRYGNIAVVRYEDQYSFFQSGQLVFSTAGRDEEKPGWEAQDSAAFAHLAMVQHKAPRRVLLIGGGLSGTLREIAEHPVKHIDYIELDEVLLQAARPYLPTATLTALEDPRVRILHGDARLHVKTSNEQYDLIVIDLPDPATAVLNRYYTKEFFMEAAALLGPEGVLVAHATSTSQLRSTAIANRNATIYHTLRTVFDHVIVAGDRVLFYIASQDATHPAVDAAVLNARYENRGVVVEAFSGRHFYTLLHDSSTRRINWVVRSHGRTSDAHLTGPGSQPLLAATVTEQMLQEQDLAPVNQGYFINSDFNPIGYFYTLMLWEGITRPFHQTILPRLLHIQPWWLLPMAAIPLTLMLGLYRTVRRSKKRQRVWCRNGTRFAIAVTVLTTGMSTIMIQIALLFAFQSIYGFVYELVGLITGFFMLGLALGAWVGYRYLIHKNSLTTLAAIQVVMALVSLLLLVGLPVMASLRSPALVFLLFSAITATAGLINGVDFPIAVACYSSVDRHFEKSAGVVYAMELFGACGSAILASTVVVPIFGSGAAFLVAAGASILACILLLIARGFSYAEGTRKWL